jgi:hypothetical protein
MNPTQTSVKLKLSKKQLLAFELLEDPTVVELDFGGAAGGAKSWTVCLWAVMQCRNYPRIRIGIGRRELLRLKQTTLYTLLREVHPLLGITESDYRFRGDSNTIIYANGSEIQLFDLAYAPSDPDYDTLGSLNLTHVIIEEVGEVQKKAKDVFGSRKDRFLNDIYGLTGKVVMTQNPSQNFTRAEFYEPYQNLGGGEYQKWPIGKVFIKEKDKEGKTIDKETIGYRVFIRSLPIDNPFLSKNYVETLKRLPEQERKRLFEGNWDYMDDSEGLFNSQLIDKSMVYDMPEEKYPKYIGVDVADKGKDKTVVSLIEGGVATKQVELSVDTTGEKPISQLYSLELIKFAQQNGFKPEDANHIAIECNGVGVGMRDFMRSNGWYISDYTATSQTRSDGYWRLHESFETNKLKLYHLFDNSNSGELRKQLSLHSYEMNDKLQPIVIQKKKIKDVLGYSPDHADSLMIANWVMTGGVLDPKQDSARIIF